MGKAKLDATQVKWEVKSRGRGCSEWMILLKMLTVMVEQRKSALIEASAFWKSERVGNGKGSERVIGRGRCGDMVQGWHGLFNF